MARSAYGGVAPAGRRAHRADDRHATLAVPAEINALAVAGLGVAASFALAWLLVSRTRPGDVL
jgi:hypothetical protein